MHPGSVRSTNLQNRASQQTGYHPEKHNAKKWCKLIKVSVPAGKTPYSQRSGKKSEITRMWGTKTETIPVIVGALGTMMPHSMKGNLKKILKNLNEEETIQEIALCGTAHILRKIL